MSEKTFRPLSLRYQGWNYAATGWYFVTICTKERIPFFGNIDGNGQMNLNKCGQIVGEEWLRMAKVRSSLELDEYSIMPDHIHGIVIIENEDAADPEDLTSANHWQAGCLGAVIGRFKERCTKRIRKAGYSSFLWQRNFYDHIIRNEKDLERIREYMHKNPTVEAFGKW